MSGAQDRAADRRAKAAAVIARSRARNRRRAIALWAALALLAGAAGTALVLVIGGSAAHNAQVRQAASAPIEGVRSYTGLSRNHVPDAAFPQEPGVGGDHAPVWTNCRTYTTPVNGAQAVHSLEHGAVWITYQPGLPAGQVRALTALATGRAYLILSPDPAQPSPVEATAWGTQLALGTASDPRLPAFVQKYTQGPQTPEPGAPCTGGANG